MSEQRVALVTGAASGIGRAVASRLESDGYLVVGCDIAPGEEKNVLRADVTDQHDVDRLVAALPGGRVDLLANVAGVMDFFLPLTDLDDAEWEHVLAVNLTGPMRLCRAVLPLMRAAGGGAIVNVASVGGLTGAVAGTAYVASKHALVGLTRSIACLYADDGIRANAVCPGGVETGIGSTATPKVAWAYERLMKGFARAGRMAGPDEVATLICWLGGAEASNVNGAVMTCDGGWTA